MVTGVEGGAKLPEEVVDVLTQGDGVRIERIVSTGHASPAGFWAKNAPSGENATPKAEPFGSWSFKIGSPVSTSQTWT